MNGGVETALVIGATSDIGRAIARTLAEELATLHWVHWYNHRRLFGPLGHVPPAAFEAHYDHQLHGLAMAA